MHLVCLDLEGVLVPEIWIGVAEATGVDELRATTRDIPDYNVLMRQRLKLLDAHGITLPRIQAVIAAMGPLEGALPFLDVLRASGPVVLLSDTFAEFAAPLVCQLGFPTLLCHSLEVDGAGCITGYRLRMADHKRAAVKAFRALNYRVLAVGDSYNDTNMLAEADQGFLFRAPPNVIREFPQFPVLDSYDALAAAIDGAARADGEGPGCR